MFISLDLETTGIDAEKDTIIEFGAVKFDLDGEKDRLQFLIDPGFTLPQIITHITGITDENLEGAPLFKEKTDEIRAFIGDLPIIGHNIQFDTNFLRSHDIEVTNPEYDTFQLASILLPGLPSYSLEILTQILDLKHEEKHRALDDAIAAMDLFLTLTEKFQALDSELIEKIHALLKKTDWPLKDFLSTLKHKKPTNPITQKPTQPHNPGPDTETIIEAKSSTLFEKIPPYENLIKDLTTKAHKDTYISIPYQTFQSLSSELPENLSQIDIPRNYLSPSRLERFLKKDFFEPYEMTSAIKYLIWSKRTKHGLLSEIMISGQERLTIPRINADPEFTNAKDEPFIKKAVEKDASFPAICSHLYLIEEKPKLNSLIIIDFDRFTKTIHTHLSRYISLTYIVNTLKELEELYPNNQTIKSLISKSTIFFGIIGIIFDKYNDDNLFNPRSNINENIISLKEWQEATLTIKNLIEASRELGEILTEDTKPILKKWKSLLVDLDEIFSSPNFENETVWIEKDMNGEAVIRSAPLSINGFIKEILENCETYKIIDESTDLSDNGAFIKKLFGLQSSLPLQNLSNQEKNIDIEIAKNTPQNEQENRHAVLNYLKRSLPKLKGSAAVICNSKEQLKFFTIELGKAFRDKGPKLVSQTLGSLGKVTEQFKQDPKNSILMLTPGAWQNFANPELIDHLFIHKLPFDPPSNTYIVTLSNAFTDPFTEFQVPRAVFNLKKTLNRLTEGRVTILDSRILKKNYSKQFLDNLLPATKIEIFTIDF